MPRGRHAALANRARIRALLSTAARRAGRLNAPSGDIGRLTRWRAALRARWLAWRNRRLGDPAFQRAAARFWPTRFVARRETRRLFDLCAGFVYSQALAACVETDLLARLAECPRTASAVADAISLPTTATERLLDSAVALGLVERLADDRYALGGLGAAMQANPAIAAMVMHHRPLYEDLADPVARLRDRAAPTGLRTYWSYADTRQARGLGAERTAGYTRLMAESQRMIAEQVGAVCDLSGVGRLLDIGGGSGVFAERMAESHPGLEVTVLDLPSVAEAARARLAASPVAGRVHCVGADMLADPWPGGFDALSLVRVLHDHEDDTVATLLQRARAALRPGGRLIVAEPMAETPGAAPVGAYFIWYLWAMGQGRPRSAATLRQFVTAQGFVHSRVLSPPIPLLARVLVADRTAATDGN